MDETGTRNDHDFTQAETTVVLELQRRESEASARRLAKAYLRLLELAHSDNPIDSILVAHLVREILSATPGALGIVLHRTRLQYENKIQDLAALWPAEMRAGDAPAPVVTELRRLLDDHDRATGRAREGPRALLTQEDRARSGFVPDPSIDRWVNLSKRSSGLAHRLRNLEALPSPVEARRLVDELTATFLATIGPFFAGIDQLDALLEIETPTDRDAERVADLLRTAPQYSYFFDRADQRWLRPLAAVRRLLSTPPELVDVGGGYVRAPDWPQGRFLARVAASDPDLVIRIIDQVPATMNPRTVAQIVGIARALPADHAVRLQNPIRARISVHLGVEYAGIDAAALAQHLADLGRAAEASDLLIAVAEAAIASPRGDDWHLEQVLADPIDGIARAGGDLGPPLRQLLRGALAGTDSFDGHSAMWLRRTDRRPGYRADRIWLLANALLRVLLASPLETAQALTAELLAERPRTFARVALAAVAQRPELLDGTVELLLDAAQLDDPRTTRFEFRQALRPLWRAASEAARESFLRYAESAEEAAELSARFATENVPNAPRPDQLRRWWRSQLLFRVRDVIPAAWLERLGPFEPVEDEESPELQEWTTPASPLPEEELEAMQPDAMLALVSEWRQTDPPRLDAPGPEELENTAANVIVRRVREFGNLAPTLASFRSRFVAAITSAVERRLREDQIEERAALVTLALNIGKAFLLRTDVDLWSKQVKRDLAGIIALAARGNVLDESTSVLSVGLLRRLLEDADAGAEPEERDTAGGRDLGILALNNVRGVATTAMIELLLLSHRAGRSGLAEVTSDYFRDVVSRDFSRSARAAIGMRLPWLLVQDSAHQADWLLLVFGGDVPPTGRDATWEAYLLYSRFFKDTASLLASQYSAAVSQVEEHSPYDGARPHHRDEQLGIHVAMAYLIAMPEEADSRWLTQFYERAPDWLQARVTRWIAEQAAATGVGAEVRERARTFLRHRVERKEDAAEAEELRAIGWIARGSDIENEVFERIVFPALERTDGATDDEVGVADLIARCSATNPLSAARALRLLVEGDPWHSLPHIAANELRSALEALIVSDNMEAREISKSVVHTLGALGFMEYRDMLGDSRLK